MNQLLPDQKPNSMRYCLIFACMVLTKSIAAQSFLTSTRWKQEANNHELHFTKDSIIRYDGKTVLTRYPFRLLGDTLQIDFPASSATAEADLPNRAVLQQENNGATLRLLPVGTAHNKTGTVTLRAILAANAPSYDWSYRSLTRDSIPGCSYYDAFALLATFPAVPVVVGVIDTGIDHSHQQLKRSIWTNRQEKAGNKKDDDKNGYVDDINGWYWMALTNGKFLVNDLSESVRVLQGDSLDNSNLGLINQARIIYTSEAEKLALLKLALADTARLARTLASFAPRMGNAVVTIQALRELPDGPDSISRAVRRLAIETFRSRPVNWAQFSARMVAFAPRYKAGYSELWNYTYNINYIPVPANERLVGQGMNPGLSEPDVLAHGTYVSGVLTAPLSPVIDSIERRNITLMDLAAAPPSGDERDELVAQAIRYAVDKGATVVNISLAKRLSAHRSKVDAALLLAQQRDVLIINCAGNDSNDNDSIPYYPIGPVNTLLGGEPASNFLEVGNSSYEWNEKLAYSSSNYGARSVDLFAPGLQIRTTAPGQQYAIVNGTSFSAPLVARVAALIRSYFPKLSAGQVKRILTESVRKPSFQVLKPGTTQLVTMNKLCNSGGILDAEAAVRLAIVRSKSPK
jgi:cell wall-associated protease